MSAALSTEQQRALAALASALPTDAYLAGGVVRDQAASIPIASAADLTAMKLQAIATRGAARDFWDLHELLRLRGLTLAKALLDFQRRYPTADLGHVVRSLGYFGDAASAPLPSGLDPARWAAIRRDFEAWVRGL